MANNVDVNLSGGNGTGINTSDPQSGAANTSLLGPQQSLQTASSSSINNQSSGISIKLQPTDLRTSAVSPIDTKPAHKLAVGGVVIVAVLIVVAVVMSIYITMTAKKSSKNI